MMTQSTSQQALNQIRSSAANIRDRVLDAIQSFGADGLTTNECAALIDIDKGTVQPRTSELFTAGLIQDSGRRRANDSGKNAIVWVAA